MQFFQNQSENLIQSCDEAELDPTPVRHQRTSSSTGAQSSSVSSADTSVLKAVQARHAQQQSLQQNLSPETSALPESLQDHYGHGLGHGGHHGSQQSPYHRRQSPLVAGNGGKSNETVLTLAQACVVEDEDSEKDVMVLQFAGLSWHTF